MIYHQELENLRIDLQNLCKQVMIVRFKKVRRSSFDFDQARINAQSYNTTQINQSRQVMPPYPSTLSECWAFTTSSKVGSSSSFFAFCSDGFVFVADRLIGDIDPLIEKNLGCKLRSCFDFETADHEWKLEPQLDIIMRFFS